MTKRTKLAIKSDKNFIASGVGEKTSKKVSTIFTKDGGSFRRKNANQYGKADGGNDYTETRQNRTDKYANGGGLKKEKYFVIEYSETAKGEGEDNVTHTASKKANKGETLEDAVAKFQNETEYTAINYYETSKNPNKTDKYETGGDLTGSPEVFPDTDTLSYAKGNMVKGKGKKKAVKKPKEPMVVRGYFEDEPYEYGNGGSTYDSFCYTIGGL